MPTICKNIQDVIETNVWEPVDDWIKTTEEKCEEDYDWWNPIGWFCWLVTLVVKVVRWFLRTIVTVILRVVCEVVNFFVNVVAAVYNILRDIPLLGPILRAITRAYTTTISYAVGLLDGLAYGLGIRITKHLRVHVIPLCEGVVPLAQEVHLAPIMDVTERTLYRRARIRVHTTIHEPVQNPPQDALRLGTGVELILDELWLKGTWYQMNVVKMFESNIWSYLGVGHPVIVYVVREVGYDGPGMVIGASGGPFVDWVAVERDAVIPKIVAGVTPVSPYPPTVASASVFNPADNPGYQKYVVAHEICHALGLLGHANSSASELMFSGTIDGDALSPLQVGIIRSSAHVTFL